MNGGSSGEFSFVGRTKELESAEQWLAPSGQDARLLLVSGDSGSGKTFYVRQLLRRLHAKSPDSLMLYVDVANDGYRSARVLSSFLSLAYVSAPMFGTSVVSVPPKLSLEKFLRKRSLRGVGRRIAKALAHGAGAFFGVGSAAGSMIGVPNAEDATLLERQLAAYLSWASRSNRVFFAVDNIQFLNPDDRLTIESIVQRVGTGLSAIFVDRTVEGVSELIQPVRCFASGQLKIVIDSFTQEETLELVEKVLSPPDDMCQQLATDVYIKTGGLAKDVEYCLTNYRLEVSKGSRADAVQGLLATIHRLPLIHRQFLIVASLLAGGVDAAIARGTVSRLTAAVDPVELENVVSDLLTSAYLRTNGPEGNWLRPGHERVISSIRKSADEDLQEEVRRSLIVELAEALDQQSDPDTETYLLHCLVGLQTAHELSRNIDHISRLIQSQHRQDQFSYLESLTDDLLEVLTLLPPHVLENLFDSLQKNSAFEKGLQVLRRLDVSGMPPTPALRAFRVRYLTQAYKYQEALELSRQLDGDDDWIKLNTITTLMALGRDDEAQQQASELLEPDCTSEVQAVLRRNTIHLFDPATALRHLDEAYRFFERGTSLFRLATIQTNRGLVHLHTGAWGDAARVLDLALDGMRQVGSREIYQAQVNEAVRVALAGDWARSLSLLAEASVHVPRALTFDQVKVDVIIAVVSRVSGKSSREGCTNALENCTGRLRGIESPYLDAAIEHNLATNRGDSLPSAPDSHDRVRLTVDLEQEDQVWSLPMSVHWRY